MKTSVLKNNTTNLLTGILDNCDVILNTCNNKVIVKKTNNLIPLIKDTIQWYASHRTKQAVNDYIIDYNILDNKFNTVLELLPNGYEYSLCMLTNGFKLTYKGK